MTNKIGRQVVIIDQTADEFTVEAQLLTHLSHLLSLFAAFLSEEPFFLLARFLQLFYLLSLIINQTLELIDILFIEIAQLFFLLAPSFIVSQGLQSFPLAL